MVYIVYYDSKLDLSELFNSLNYIFENSVIEKLYEYIKDKKSDIHIVFIDINDFRSKYFSNLTDIEFEKIVRALMYIGVLGFANNSYYVIIPMIERYI